MMRKETLSCCQVFYLRQRCALEVGIPLLPCHFLQAFSALIVEVSFMSTPWFSASARAGTKFEAYSYYKQTRVKGAISINDADRLSPIRIRLLP